MKLKKTDSITVVKLILTGQDEIDAFENSYYYWMDIKIKSHNLITGTMLVTAYIKTSEFPKLEAFVLDYNENNLS